MRDLTYPPIIVTAKTGFRLLGQQIDDDRHRARAPHRRRAARRQPHRLRRLRLRRPRRRTRRGGWSGSWPSASCSTTGRRPADAVAAPHRGRPRRRRGVVRHGGATTCDAGEAVGIFPEATISRAMELKEFKTGAVRIAAEAGVPLVPVVLWGTQRMMTKDHPRTSPAARPSRSGSARRCTPPATTRSPRPPSCTRSMTRAARRGDPRLPRRRAAARLLVGARVVRRQRADPRGGRRAWTPRRSATRAERRPRTGR